MPKERKRLRRKSVELADALESRAFWIGLLRSSTDLCHRIIMIAALVAGVHGLQTGRLEISSLLAILGVAALVGAPLRGLGRVYEYWKNNRVAQEKIGRFLAENDAPRVHQTPLRPGEGRVEINGLRLGTRLHVDTLTVEPGQRIALLGDNGSGKSTVLRLIAGLSAPDKGQVLLDGADTRRLSHADRRRAIGIASHQLTLVRGSISKNIRYRVPGASREAVDDVCANAGIRSRILTFPHGLSTRLDDGGQGLSEGEAARVKLARAILSQPRLLLLDEIELGLDGDGRRAVKRLLDSYPGTVVFATHDTEIVSYADRVWTLRSGQIEDRSATHSAREARA